jgi:5-methyltetrahydropteroyltriglutamate--homocysteine methyltransferase
LRSVLRKQAEAGVDIGNNGEQQREGFFLHIRHRMSGFGGSWQRRAKADALRYPVFQGNWCSEARETTAGSVLERLFAN